ncbi:MarR family transcriptional regulator [Streptomyces sp. T-3]|nr:MarR family transcriptional regulator [Streptomyces sp. T-3]
MPGDRLTDEDRRHIASGLAEGLGYAEIARQLSRPTSTVSREVARNGGPDGYRADHAHRATGRRARRGRTAPATGLPPAAAEGGRDPEAVRGFVEQFAALMVQTGLPPMASRVLATLVTTDAGALTSAELVQQLQVSPASVSKAIGYLEGLELVRRESDAHHRRQRYLIDDEVWVHTWLTSARTHAILAETAQQGTALFDAATPTGARLQHMGEFFARLSSEMSGGPESMAATDDTLTVLAALQHAATALTAGQLATALGWSTERVTEALDDAGRHADRLDPFALRRTARGAYVLTAHKERLSPAQHRRISGLRPDGAVN